MADTRDWEKVGVIGVDAGLCWIGDPCYIIRDSDDARPSDIGDTWHGFCERLHDRERGSAAQWNYDAGHAGLGVTVGTGYGDGEYAVYVKRKGGRVMAVMVDFEGATEDEAGEEK